MERMEEVQRKLQEAAVEGNLTSLLILLQEDKLVFDRCAVTCPAETPLHIAAMLGHLEFTREILCRKPELVKELDFHRSSPLHLAAANGHLEVVKALLLVNADMCLAKDRNGWNPLHIAVIKGRIDILIELVRDKPDAIRTRGQRGETILHLCVKHYQLDELKFLMETIDDSAFVNSEDDDGLTILHQGVADRAIQIINYLVTETPIEVNALNANGFTALDIVLSQGRRNIEDIDIQNTLREAGAISSKDMPSTMHGLDAIRANDSSSTVKSKNRGRKKNWLEERRNALMVVASLIATMAFQAGISPPNGIWQEDLQQSISQSHEAGRSIMAYKLPDKFAFFVGLNTTSFLASIGVILLLISGLPFRRRFLMWILMIIMWIAMIATILTYSISVSCLSSRGDKSANTNAGGRMVFSGVMGVVLIGHFIRLIRKIVNYARRSRARRSSRSATS